MFEISADNLCWINENTDDPEDLCAHGNVKVKIGDESYEYYCTVSAAALYLLKSITEDHIMDTELQLLPCCGFFMVEDPEKSDNVIILGCPNGIDWTVTHNETNVILTTRGGQKVTVSLNEYIEQIFEFADKIQDFYKHSSPKTISDETKKKMYDLFWREWKTRRNPNVRHNRKIQ